MLFWPKYLIMAALYNLKLYRAEAVQPRRHPEEYMHSRVPCAVDLSQWMVGGI